MKYRAPISFLLQAFAGLKSSPDSQIPFHLEGTGPRPSSQKTSDSGQIPVRDIRELAWDLRP